eukprot:gnl/TRDRNA2_/TRDRNA2_183881_c0_seq1.p1 gnl/TRDRNA2_/TRDRNA2_183881_c0~~gnl/TRDRNA2_/TRDRNA2_183881_c0_seq1.p1  ORF type:complete len:276 (-),score=72.63 gnl/TRDRNA2_/TRDRNA2_183881_c0_seq1:62-889(-)
MNQLKLIDTDGDHIEFRLSAGGKLQEYVNGKLEIARVRTLKFRSADGLVIDDGGDFNLRPYEQEQKAAALRALAAQARNPPVRWLGDVPTAKAYERLVFVDLDGDAVEFRLPSHYKALQLYINGELEIPTVRTLNYRRADAAVLDGLGEIRFRPEDHLEKVAELYEFASRAGVKWRGDVPSVLPCVKPPQQFAMDGEDTDAEDTPKKSACAEIFNLDADRASDVSSDDSWSDVDPFNLLDRSMPALMAFEAREMEPKDWEDDWNEVEAWEIISTL